MSGGSPPGRASPEDEVALERHARNLAEAVDAALPAWVEVCVRSRAGTVDLPGVAEAAEAARVEVGAVVAELLVTDIDEQRTTPLTLLRRAVVHPTRVLAAAGVSPVERDEFARRTFPDDPYDLTPAAFGDLGPEVHEAGLAWSAAKAHVHLARRRSEGRT